jgi:hypothetical protein
MNEASDVSKISHDDLREQRYLERAVPTLE